MLWKSLAALAYLSMSTLRSTTSQHCIELATSKVRVRKEKCDGMDVISTLNSVKSIWTKWHSEMLTFNKEEFEHILTELGLHQYHILLFCMVVCESSWRPLEVYQSPWSFMEICFVTYWLLLSLLYLPILV